jgi:hypothetical protein
MVATGVTGSSAKSCALSDDSCCTSRCAAEASNLKPAGGAGSSFHASPSFTSVSALSACATRTLTMSAAGAVAMAFLRQPLAPFFTWYATGLLVVNTALDFASRT